VERPKSTMEWHVSGLGFPKMRDLNFKNSNRKSSEIVRVWCRRRWRAAEIKSEELLNKNLASRTSEEAEKTSEEAEKTAEEVDKTSEEAQKTAEEVDKTFEEAQKNAEEVDKVSRETRLTSKEA
jgi:methyl-accepting chemotaxis protein